MKYVITYPLAYSLGIGYIISYLRLKGLKAIGSKRFFMADDSFTIDKSWLREFLPR